MKIEIDLNELLEWQEYEDRYNNVGEFIVDCVVTELKQKLDLKDTVDKIFNQKVEEYVNRQANLVLDKKIEEIIEGFLDKPILSFNRWGEVQESSGETFRDTIAKKFEEASDISSWQSAASRAVDSEVSKLADEKADELHKSIAEKFDAEFYERATEKLLTELKERFKLKGV